jgi:D-sedoheptulose 7-phosphate isomerase
VENSIKQYIQEVLRLEEALLEDKGIITDIAETITMLCNCFKTGHKLLIAGNGGSAADAQHFAAEMVGRFKNERKAFPAVALTTDTSIITAWSNDHDFSTVFSRQIEALGKQGDVFMGISTSGKSKNIVEGVRKANELGLKTVCLLGNDGGALHDMAHVSIKVPSKNTPRIQELHILIIHIICEEVEKTLS